MRVTGVRRKLLALAGLAVLATLAWYTMDTGKVRMLVMVLLGGFALRIALTAKASQADADEEAEPHEGLQ